MRSLTSKFMDTVRLDIRIVFGLLGFEGMTTAKCLRKVDFVYGLYNINKLSVFPEFSHTNKVDLIIIFHKGTKYITLHHHLDNAVISCVYQLKLQMISIGSGDRGLAVIRSG